MKPLSKIAAGVSPSATLAVSALAKKMKAEGKDVIGFGAGEPDFATPDRISYAGVRAICDGKTRYTPAAGMIELRQAICDRVKTDYGLEYEPTQAVVASGAKHMVYIALAALVDPGDEVIVPSPYWVSYYEMVRLFGGVPVVVDVSEEQGFQLAPEQLLMLDDLKPGYDMCRAAGVPFAAAGWANDIPEIEGYMRRNCDYYFKTVAAFGNFLEQQ